jgi:hypothetical protein
LVDRDGRLFGRVNVVDAFFGVFLVGLIPVAYGSLVLFRPSRPRIASVSPTAVNQEDRRIANGLEIRQKLKVKGEHLTPMLHANIDATPAIGFTFEDPTSADVIVGPVPMGTHDLVLFDGVQEVARARGAVVILPTPGAAVRVLGTMIQLDDSTAKAMHAGQRFEVSGSVAAEILQLGDVEPDRQRVKVETGHIEAPVAGAWQRSVALRVGCQPDPDAAVCRTGSTTLGDKTSPMLNVPGSSPPLRLLIGEVLPDTQPRAAVAHVRATGQRQLLDAIRPGDRDIRGGPFDDRAASVTSVKPSAPDAVDVVLRFGLDRVNDGWRYRAESVEPGSPFSLVTDRYALIGTLVSVVLDER